MLAAPVLLTFSCSVLCLIDLRDADEPIEKVLLDMLCKSIYLTMAEQICYLT